ncbi:MAG: hypothetical protein QTN59_03810 [Candidatus Electrothrix communis]|nr:MAG: hypothetical protein QTN59_03810 [Candidatus Electrothrix communis]
MASKVKQVEEARAQDQKATQDLDNYRGTIRKISKTVHPFKLDDNKPQDSANVAKELREQAKNIETLACKTRATSLSRDKSSGSEVSEFGKSPRYEQFATVYAIA